MAEETKQCPCCGQLMVKSSEGAIKERDGRMLMEWRWRCLCGHAISGGYLGLDDFHEKFNARAEAVQTDESKARYAKFLDNQRIVDEKREAALKANRLALIAARKPVQPKG
jgi:hypothetical protein